MPVSRERLRALFEPRSVAVVGVSSDPIKPGARALRFLRMAGTSRIVAVGPSAGKIEGVEAYSSIDQLKEPVDSCIVAVRPTDVLGVVRDGTARGVKSFVVLSSGFSEAGPEGAAIERKLTRYCMANGVALLGPNCFGVVNFTGHPSLTFASIFEDKAIRSGETAFVAQSGAVAALTGKVASEALVGLSHIVSTGNEAALSTCDLSNYLLDDPGIASVAMYIENADDASQLLALTRRARSLGKNVAIMIGGTTDAGRRAAASHTGALSGEMATLRSLLENENVQTVSSPSTMVAALMAFQAKPLTKRSAPAVRSGGRPGAAIVTGSGGMGVLIADILAGVGVDLAELASETTSALREILPPHASIANPIDVTATVNLSPAPLQATVMTLAEDPNVDPLILIASGAVERVINATLDAVRGAASAGKNLFVVWPDAPRDAREIATGLGALIFQRLEDACFASVAWRRRADNPTRSPMIAATKNHEGVKSKRSDNAIQRPREDVLKKVLEAAGLQIPVHEIVSKRSDVAEAGRRIGYPLVLKLVAPVITHKTDLKAVEIDLRSEADLLHAYDRMHHDISLLHPGEELELMIEAMAPPGIDLAVSIGKRLDLDVIMVGSGGIAIEAFKDVAFCDAASGEDGFLNALRRTRIGSFLEGPRGRLFDHAALLSFRAKLTDYFAQAGLEELELNPVRIHPAGGGVSVLDAVGTPHQSGESR